MLYVMTQDRLARALMPLGEMAKDDVRDLAHRWSLPVADKPESQDICFVPYRSYTEFIERYAPESIQDGAIIDETGRGDWPTSWRGVPHGGSAARAGNRRRRAAFRDTNRSLSQSSFRLARWTNYFVSVLGGRSQLGGHDGYRRAPSVRAPIAI